MRRGWEELEEALEDDETLYGSSPKADGPQQELYGERVQEYAEDVREYVSDLWDSAVEEYFGPELSGYDRLQDTVAERAVAYSPDIENPYAAAVADQTVEFGRSFGQAVAGALTTPSALYDAVQEWKETGEHPISPYVQMEEHRDSDGSVAEVSGKAAGFVTGAALAVQFPFVLLAGAAQTGRHLAERKSHHYLRERLLGEDIDEIPEDDGMNELYHAVSDAAVDVFRETVDSVDDVFGDRSET